MWYGFFMLSSRRNFLHVMSTSQNSMFFYALLCGSQPHQLLAPMPSGKWRLCIMILVEGEQGTGIVFIDLNILLLGIIWQQRKNPTYKGDAPESKSGASYPVVNTRPNRRNAGEKIKYR
ncbi:unnamed protein product, partial [Staurois parvus]